MAKLAATIPPVRYRRTPSSFLKRLTRPFTAPFREILGGPDLEHCDHRRVDCGVVDVEFFLPAASFGGEAEYPTNVDLKNIPAPEMAYEYRTEHDILRLGVSNWKYGRPKLEPTRFLPVPQGPYVIVTTSWQLERIKNSLRLEVGNTAMLEQYLTDDYYAHLESEGGRNWKIRARTQNELEPRGWDQESIDEQIATQLFDPPKNYESMMFNGVNWLRYIWAPRQNYPKALSYTCVLTPSFLLTVSFGLTEMTAASLKHWWSPLVEDSEILIQGVKLHYKNLSDTI
ncbi:hypothetical protein OQJ46_11725 [Microbulbifer thermotolerans]|uniref:Uncharacterized protein n=1 Tax=Microbulbifer thermotolerans TaxID=252514 RepID=A0AB35HXL9_MICTH|nr:hypothetical protein [Microbulbifer thermotolerans]MCX2783654.1 hypothetical protein [Microbulbifer thermotolerans]MCX2796504.1 hypothetical protein [Microbulbifer thermotolerans]MCX2801517.1 hypothetical protein [Microbulbifer thermotolerans]MCX2836444.1 hypothetical protein [Microbulbifer thermotolerans]